MKKIIYCVDNKLKKIPSFPFPFPFVITSKISEAHHKDPFFVIFEEKFLRRRPRMKLSCFSDKICFIHFHKEDKNNLKLIKKFGFFDYFTDEDGKEEIAFKLKRAKQIYDLKERIKNLEKELSKKDKKLAKIILIDPSTDCYNWRYFLLRARQELSRARSRVKSRS
jgi:hypothetical protein